MPAPDDATRAKATADAFEASRRLVEGDQVAALSAAEESVRLWPRAEAYGVLAAVLHQSGPLPDEIAARQCALALAGGALRPHLTAVHEENMLGTALSADGTRLFSIDDRGWMIVHDVDRAIDVVTAKLDDVGPVSLALFPDGRRVALGLRSGGVAVWSIDGEVKKLAAPEDVLAWARPVQVAPDGRTIFLARDAEVSAIDAATGTSGPATTLGKAGNVVQIVAPDARSVFVGTSQGWVGALDASLKERWAVKAHAGSVTSLAAAADGAISAGEDGSLVRVAAGRVAWSRAGASPPAVPIAALRVEGEEVRGLLADGTARVWNAATGAPEQEVRFALGGAAGALQPGYTSAVFGGGDRAAFTFNADVGTIGMDATAHAIVSWSQARVLDVIAPPGVPLVAPAFGPARELAALGRDGAVRIWSDVDQVRAYRPSSVGFWGGAQAFAWSPDGRELAVTTADRTALVDVTTGVTHTSLAGGSAVAFRPDGAAIAVASKEGVSIFGTDGSRTDLPTPPGAAFARIAFAGSDQIAGLAGGLLYLVRTAGAVRIGAGVADFAVAPRAGRIVVLRWNDPVVHAYGFDGSELPAAGRCSQMPFGVDVTDDGSTVACSGDGVVDVLRGGAVRTVAVGTGPVQDVALSKDGRFLVAALLDRLALVEVDRGTRTAVLVTGHVEGKPMPRWFDGRRTDPGPERYAVPWLVVADDGRVDGSPDAIGILTWRTPSASLPGIVGWDEHARSTLFARLVAP